MSFIVSMANRAYMAGAAPAARRFGAASRAPAVAQVAVLRRILTENADTAYGRRHGFATIQSPEEYRARVPLTDYDALEGEMARVMTGDRRVLTREPPVCFELTGGSMRANKLIPCTRALLREFSAATLPWTFDLLRRRPGLRDGRAYWAVTPPARHATATAGGIPIGLGHDSDYFPSFARVLLDHVVGTPRALSRVRDVGTWRRLTARALLAMDDLCFISVWNPSFLTLLAEAIRADFARLLDDLEYGTIGAPADTGPGPALARAFPARPRRARHLRSRFGRTAPDSLALLWPKLQLISCWTDAHAARALPAMRAHFPDVEVQGKGLLATEGVVSFPLLDAGGSVAAVTSHFLEFLPERGGDPVGVHQVQTGRVYEVVLTTSGGLYRYRLRDLVQVEHWYRNLPVLSFLGRGDQTSDLAGEKITPAFAESALRQSLGATRVPVRFAMLAPRAANGTRARYDLLVDCDARDADRLGVAVEEQLARSHHYALCRRLGQLDPVRAVVVPDAQRRYEHACIERGQRISAIKPVALGACFGDT